MASRVISCHLIENVNASEVTNEDGFADFLRSMQDYMERGRAFTDGQRKRRSEFPELTDSHILNAFMDSGVTNNHVHQLGSLLGLQDDVMQTISKDGGPAIFALNTVNAWLKKDPKRMGDDIQQTFVELEDKLRQVRLNCVIGKLRDKEAKVYDLELTDLVGDIVENFSIGDAFKFGRKMGLSFSDMQGIVQENSHLTRGSYIGLAFFKEAERRNTILKHSFVTKTKRVLMDFSAISGLQDDEAERMRTRCIIIEKNSLERHREISQELFQSQNGVQTVGGANRTSVFTKEQKKNKWMSMFKCLVAFAITINILSVILIPILLTVPAIQKIPRQAIIADDTIKYELDPSNSVWLNSVELELIGEVGCSAHALTMECENVVSDYFISEQLEMEFFSDYIYLTKGTTVSFKAKFSFPSITQCPLKRVWIFNDINEAKQHSANNFLSLACLNPKAGVTCLNVENTDITNATFLVPSSSYYFIRCDNDPACNSFANLTVSGITAYDFEASLPQSIDSTNIVATEAASLSVQRNYLQPQMATVCILLMLEHSKDECSSDEAHQVIITGIRNTYLAIYPAAILTFSLAATIIILVSCGVVGHCNRKNRSHNSSRQVLQQQLRQRPNERLRSDSSESNLVISTRL